MAEQTPAQPLHAIPAPRQPVPLWSRRTVGFPAMLSPVVGRERELAALHDLMRVPGCRLLTLVGPGGSGKTRLALALAEELAAGFAEGAIFVPLAAIAEPGDVLQAVARPLDVRDAAGLQTLDAVVSALRERQLLLVLDNFEHVAAAATDIAALLEGCPGISILVTSRAPLRVHGERQFATPPLALPDSAADMTPAELAGYGAVGLFIERAGWVSNDFALHADNAQAVVEICRRLDGLPLAIELAAAWMRVLSPAALLARMEQRLPWLDDGTSDRPARLRTMRDAIAWSHDLLTPEERGLFARLAVFVGGFGLEGSEAVWTAAPHGRRLGESPAVFALLAGLIDKSLLQRVDGHGSDPRFAMLETVREFALDQLAARGETAAMESARASHLLSLAEMADAAMTGAGHADWLGRLDAEHANARAALAWFLAQGDAEHGLRLASALTWFWSSRGFLREARTWLETFLAMPTTASTRGRGLLDAANVRDWLGDNERAAMFAREALALVRELGDRYSTMVALRRLGSIAIDQGDFGRAESWLGESRALLRDTDPAWDFAFAPYQFGRLASARGRHDEAVAAYAEAADAFRALNDRGYVAAALARQGGSSLRSGAFAAARAPFAESLELACEVRDQASLSRALAGAAHLAHAAGESATATRLLAKATSIREATGEKPLPRTTLDVALQAALGWPRFSSEWDSGAAWPESDAVAEARAIFASAGRDAADQARQWSLTRREWDVLRLLGEGRTDKEIGGALNLSRRTVSNHVGSILTKLGVESRTAAVAVAMRRGLL